MAGGLIVLSVYLTAKGLGAADTVVGWMFPGLSWSDTQGLLFGPGSEDCYEMHDYTCTDHINSLGIRDHETPLERTHAIRILAIGDSVTFGWGVNIEDAWCKCLEANLRESGMDVEVLNLGKPAAGPREYARIAEVALPRLRPDIVLVCWFDAEDTLQLSEETMRTPKTYVLDTYPNLVRLSSYLLHRNAPASGFVMMQTAADNRKYYADTARLILDRMGPEQRASFERLEPSVREAFLQGKLNPWMIDQSTCRPEIFLHSGRADELRSRLPDAERQLARIRDAAQRAGCCAIVVCAPEGYRVNAEAFRNIQRVGYRMGEDLLRSNAPDEVVGEACSHVGIACFHGLAAEYRKHEAEPGLFFEFDRHMSPTGNHLFADLLTPLVARDIRDGRCCPARDPAAVKR